MVFLVRHGSTAANLSDPPKLLGGKLNPSLAPQGVKQAEAVRDALTAAQLRHVYASPLRRSTETASIAAMPQARIVTPRLYTTLKESLIAVQAENHASSTGHLHRIFSVLFRWTGYVTAHSGWARHLP
jgi:phosphohistidine phosphatase SixA